MLFSIFVVYIAAILAMRFYEDVGFFIRRLLTAAARSVSEAVGFVLILVLTAMLLQFLISRTYKDMEFPGVRQVDQLGGMVLGFVVTTLWIGLALIGIDFVLGTPSPGTEASRQGLSYYFHTSAIIPIFYQVLPIAFATLKPWVPKGQLPDIFELSPF
jgi:uncharacterized membrane protein required for colicin V production